MAEELPRLTRRQLLIALGAAGVTGGAAVRILQAVDDDDVAVLSEPPAGTQTTPGAGPPPDPTPDPAGSPEPGPTAERREEPQDESPAPEPAEPEAPAEPQPPVPEPYVAVAGEVYPEAKLLAAGVAQALTTYRAGEELDAVVARSLLRPRAGIDAAAVAQAVAPLLVPGAASAGRVVYPQLGGLTPASAPQRASVMVVTEQQVDGPHGARTVTRTIDVRLIVQDGAWHVDTVASAGGAEVDRPPGLPPEAAAVLDDPRIALPDSARWDIHQGVVDLRLLATLRQIADRHPLAVTCLRNGHPLNVFGTDRTSNHTAGRGADIWRVGREAVVSQQPAAGTPAWEVNEALFAAGIVPELGGPWAFDGFGGRSFTDDVHLDHLHVAFSR